MWTLMMREEKGIPRQGRLIEEEEEVGEGEVSEDSSGGSGVGMGVGNPVAGSLAGLAWLTWIVRQAEPSSYTTWYGLGTLFTTNGPFHRGASLLVRSGGVVNTNMRLPSQYGLVAAGAGGGAICWWVIESHCLSASMYAAGSSRDGEAQALLSRSGGSVGSLPVTIMEAEKPWGS